MPNDLEQALALARYHQRRLENKDKPRVNNGLQFAGADMVFYCTTCDAAIIVPELYLRRVSTCEDCQALRLLGWIE